MKKMFFSLITFLILTTPIFSQADTLAPTTVNPSFEYFTVETYSKPQSAWNKNVPIYVKFVATIDSDSVQITWDVPYGIEVIPKHPKFVAVKAGQTYIYKAEIKPKIAGSYNIAANVIAWQYNTNYTSSGNTFVIFSPNLLTNPVSPNYSIGVVMKWVIIILILAIVGFLGYIYAIKSKKKFDKWFNLPD